MRNQAGMSLVELMVALAVSALVLMAAADGSLWSLKETSYLNRQKDAQKFLLEEQSTFFKDVSVRQKAFLLEDDSLLKKCLTMPCLKKCRTYEIWRATDWGRLDANLKRTPSGKKLFGSAFKQDSSGRFRKCPLLPPTELIQDYHFPTDCIHRAHASWRSGGGDTLLLKIQYQNVAENIYRQMLQRVSIAKDLRTGTCRKAAAVSCAGDNIFITKVNLQEEEFECSFIQRRDP